MLKHSKSDQLLNSLHGQGQGNEQTGHKNNRKLKVITAEYHWERKWGTFHRFLFNTFLVR